jgi:DNA-binding phage protein
MESTTTSYEAGLKEDLANPQEAAAYLNAALEDGSQDGFLVYLHGAAWGHSALDSCSEFIRGVI